MNELANAKGYLSIYIYISDGKRYVLETGWLREGGVFISMYSSWREGISEQRGEFISYSLLCTYIR